MRSYCLVSLSLLLRCAEAQTLQLDAGLPVTAVAAVDFGGYVPWSTVESLTPREAAVVKLLEKRDYKLAEAALNRLIADGPGRLTGYSLLLQALRGQKDGKGVKALVQEYQSRGGGLRLSAKRIAYAQALALELSISPSSPEDYQKCSQALRRAQSGLDAHDVGGWIAVADAWSSGTIGKFGKFGKARRVMEQAVSRNPSSVAARYFLMIQYTKGVLGSNRPVSQDDKPRPDLAVREAEAVVKLDPKFRQAYYFGGLAKLQIGDKKGAVLWLRTYRDLNPYKKGSYYDNAERVVKSVNGAR